MVRLARFELTTPGFEALSQVFCSIPTDTNLKQTVSALQRETCLTVKAVPTRYNQLIDILIDKVIWSSIRAAGTSNNHLIDVLEEIGSVDREIHPQKTNRA